MSDQQEPSPTLGLVLKTDTLDREQVRAAIAGELDVEVVADESIDHTAVVTIEDDRHGHFVMTFATSGKSPIVRAIEKPSESRQSVEILALLAGNLVRSEADDLLVDLRARRADIRDERPPAANSGDPRDLGQTSERREPKAPVQPVQEVKPMPERFVNLSLFHPLAYPTHSESYRYRLSLGLLYSRIGGLDGFAHDAIVSRVDGDWNGVIVAGIASYARGRGAGIRVSGAVNVSEGEVQGVEVAGAVNVDGTDHDADSHARSSGLRAAGAYDHSGLPFAGLQVAGGGSVNIGSLDGVQAGGAFGFVDGDVSGLQASGAATIATGKMSGVQAGGAVSMALGGVDGLQASGAANIAGDVSGLQFSVVNIGGHVEGAQIGIVNYAEELDGFSLGIVPLSGNGSVHAVAWASSTSPANVGVKFLNGPIYTITHVGYRQSDGIERVAPGMLIGGHLPLSSFFVEVDAGYSKEIVLEGDERKGEDFVRYRGSVGWQLVPSLALFAGGGLRQRLPVDGRTLSHSPEVFAGIQIF